MAYFKKTYQDNLRELKKEQIKQEALKPKEEIKQLLDPFESYVFDISNIDLDPIELAMLYKKNFAKIKHTYTFTMPVDAKYVRRQTNIFTDIENILPNIIPDCKSTDGDFLTGYYLAKYHLRLPKVLTSFHAGISKDSLTQGIYYSLAKTQPNTKWQMFGCDSTPVKKYEPIIRNGIRKPCDIYNANTISSINVQLSESISQGSLDLYTCDIRSKSTADVIKQLVLVREFLAPTAQIVLRLPTNWNSYYTSMSTFLLFCISYFTNVKIIKTPWGVIPKYYLILQNMKATISAKEATTLQTYLSVLLEDPNVPLISQTYFNIDEQEILMQNINQAYTHMMSFDTLPTNDEAIDIWTDIVS